MIPYRVRILRGEPSKPKQTVLCANTAGESLDLALREIQAAIDADDSCSFTVVDVSLGQLIMLAAYDPWKTIDIRCCHVCGCSDDDACTNRCSWIGPNLCSNCAGKPIPGGGA